MDVIAIYAAVIATASLVWQIWSYWQRRRPQARVTVRLVESNMPRGPARIPDGPSVPLRYDLEVMVMNVGHVTFEAQGVYPRSARPEGPSWGGALLDQMVLTPDASPSRGYIDIMKLPDDAFVDGVIAELHLVTGERFRSGIIFPEREAARRVAQATTG